VKLGVLSKTLLQWGEKKVTVIFGRGNPARTDRGKKNRKGKEIFVKKSFGKKPFNDE